MYAAEVPMARLSEAVPDFDIDGRSWKAHVAEAANRFECRATDRAIPGPKHRSLRATMVMDKVMERIPTKMVDNAVVQRTAGRGRLGEASGHQTGCPR
jgi:hypothetical protein